MGLRKLRLQQAWSQEQLAQLSGLSVRTIQRIERGNSPSLESLKSLAPVFDCSLAQIEAQLQTMGSIQSITEEGPNMQHSNFNTSPNTSAQDIEEQAVIEHVRELKGFYTHLVTYLLVMALLLVINLTTNSSYLWVVWPALGWGIGIINHGLNAFEVFDLFGARWERKQIEKRLGRKL